MDREAGNLIPLKDAGDLEIDEGESDVRGWPVLGREGKPIGRVAELLVDRDALEVRELDVGVDEEALGPDAAGRHLLVPLRDAQLDREQERVILAGVSRADIVALVRREGGTAAEHRGRDRQAAREEATALEPAPAREDASDKAPREARIPRVEEELDVQRRLEDAGEVRVHKRVQTEHVARDIDAAREDYDVQRLPADEANASAPSEGEIRIPIVEEEIVAEKRPVVREVLVLRKRVVTDTRRVEADLQRERVEVERRGRAGGEDVGVSGWPAERRDAGGDDESAREADQPRRSGNDI